MKKLDFLIGIFAASVFVGCESTNHQTTGRQSEKASVEQATIPRTYAGTNIFYEFDNGPGNAFFVLQSDYNFMQMTGGTRVVVVDGHFPSVGSLPSNTEFSQKVNPLGPNGGRRDMSLIDDTTR